MSGRRRSLVGVTVCCLALVSCAQVQQMQQASGMASGEDAQLIQVGVGLFQEVPESREIAMGQEMSAMLLGAADLSDFDGLQRYVSRVGLWLALQTERSELPWRFGVLETAAVNAFAAPGGYVFVTRGLLEQLDSEAELAGVLAHEIAHVLHRHHLDAMKQDRALDLLSGLGARVVEEGGHAGAAESLPEELRTRVSNAARALYARGLNRADEHEADETALLLMARAGYDPIAFVAVLQKLSRMNQEDGKLALLFQTHPAPVARLDHLAKHWTSGDRGGGYLELATRYRQHVR